MTTTDEHHFVDLEGVRLHWVELGASKGQVPIVLLHGLNNSHRTWKNVAPAFAKERRVLMPDLPGHGHSGRPDASYDLAWHAHLIALWLHSLKIDKADVIGHSFGGGVAQMLLKECPERVRRLCLVAPGGLGKDVGWILRLASLPVVVEHFGQPFMALGTRLTMRGIGTGVTEEDIEELSAFNSLPGSARAFARTVRDVIDWRGQRRSFFECERELPRVPPVLVLWGDRDAFIPIAQGEQFAAQFTGAVFKAFEGCGHFLHNEKPEEFAVVVGQFLGPRTMPSIRSVPAKMNNSSQGGKRNTPPTLPTEPSVIKRQWPLTGT